MSDELQRLPCPKLPFTNLDNLTRSSDPIASLRAQISNSGHDVYNRALGIKSEAEARMALSAMAPTAPVKHSKPNVPQHPFQRGETVQDRVKKVRVTIIKASHDVCEVVDNRGNSWRTKTTNLVR